MKKSIKALVILLLTLCFMSGCDMTVFDTETLMKPPRPVGTMAEIQATLEAYTGVGFTLKYPRSGDYRSAIFMADLDSDGKEEAGAFYRPANESGGTHFVVMDYLDGKWTVMDEITGPGVDVERITLTYFDESDQVNLLIGWNMYSRDKIGTVYYYDGNELIPSLTEFSYTEMIVADMDQDGVRELFSLLLNTTDMTSVGKLHERNPQTGFMQTTAEIKMDGNISGYAKIQSGSLMGQETCLVIDSYKGSSTMSTEVIYWNDRLERLQVVGRLFVDDLPLSDEPLLRDKLIESRDVDQDKIMEVPSLYYCRRLVQVNTEAEGETLESVVVEQQAESYIVWLHIYSYYEAKPIAYSVRTQGYSFLLNPETAPKWLENYYYKLSNDATVLTFFQNDTDTEVLRICLFTESAWSGLVKNGYTEVLRNNGLVYALHAANAEITDADLEYISAHFYLN